MAYKIYEGSPPALLQKRGAELLLVCFHELLVAGFAFFGPSRFFALSEQDKGAHSPQRAAGAAVPAAGAAPR